MRSRAVPIGAALLAACAAAGEFRPLVVPSNMKVLECEMPDTACRFAGSSAPGQLFFPGEPVNIMLVLARDKESGTAKDFALEIREITTRTPDKVDPKEGFTDTSGPPDLIAVAGKPVLYPLTVAFDDRPEVKLEVRDLPLPGRFGTYALILVRGKRRQFLATLARVPCPRPGGNLDNTPVFGEGQFFSNPARFEECARIYQRMGIHGMRCELGWSESKDGQYDWSRYDPLFRAASEAGIQIMVTLGGHPWHFLPFGEPTPAADWRGSPYWGCADWLCAPELYPRYGKWITAFCDRYWQGGRGALWGIDHYNEPWEGGGISGWARDAREYRSLLKLIAESAWKVDRRIKICAASSIMNTEDKLYADGSREFDQYIDIFTDHYVVPPMCYGPMVARAHGKESVETETWVASSEYILPQVMTQFMAAGQLRLSPWHPRVLYDYVPGVNDSHLIPTPLATATAVFNHFVTGKRFERIVFRDHLPWVFQFGKDDDRDALLVVFGRLATIFGTDPRNRVWAQVEGSEGGTMTIDNSHGLLGRSPLKFYDLAGNPIYEKERNVTLPMSPYPTYVLCPRGVAAAVERLRSARIEGKRPVEILPRDFTTLLVPRARLTVAVHNCLNRRIRGSLAVTPPKAITLATTEATVELAAGETKSLTFEVVAAQPSPANVYPFEFRFTSDAGRAEYKEVLNVCVALKGSKSIDGNLDDWKAVPGITLAAGKEKVDIAQLLREPWLALKEKEPDGSFAELKLAWDESFLYIAAMVNDPTPQTDKLRMETRDDNLFFHSAADDTLPYYKDFLAKRPGRSFAEVPWVYAKRPWTPQVVPWGGDRLQFGIDTDPPYEPSEPSAKLNWHDLSPTTDRVPYGFHAVPDTDYEYSLYLCQDGKSECWRLLAPGVPRMHDFPRCPRGAHATGVVRGARHVVRQDGKVRIYELAIPKAELADLHLAAGTTFGFVFRVGNNDGPNIDYATDKAVTKVNGLSLHPYWETKPMSCGVRWALISSD